MMQGRTLILGALAGTAALTLYACGGGGGGGSTAEAGANPNPVQLVFPTSAPLSATAQLGRQLFFDASLSGSGQQSCASCHDPANAYGPPPGSGSVMIGGSAMNQYGVRAVPSLEYLYRQTNFSIGPDNPENEGASAAQAAASAAGATIPVKNAGNTSASATALVPQGGLFWDGRINTLQDQAQGPLFNPLEMDAGSVATVATKLRATSYATQFAQLFGAAVLADDQQLVSEALFAIARYQIEDTSFHPFTSKFDAWLQGKASFTTAELAGYQAFNDPARGNCAACHLDSPTTDKLPPLFTDTQYEALGVPRNAAIPANATASYYDLGLCGPYRTDLQADTQYCGMFLTPSLRNADTRSNFFHNGYYHSLQDVLNFYNQRDVAPQNVYPTVGGTVASFNDIPAAYQANVDRVDPPFNRQLGQAPAMSQQDITNIIAFLHTIDDGYTGN